MREILFRGRAADTGAWIESETLIQHDGTVELWCIKKYQIGSETEATVDYPVAVDPETVGQYTGLTDRTGRKIFEGDTVVYFHEVKKLVPVEDIRPEEDHHGKDEVSGLPLAYRTHRTIRYKGRVSFDPLSGVSLNLGNDVQWWRHVDGCTLTHVEVTGTIWE